MSIMSLSKPSSLLADQELSRASAVHSVKDDPGFYGDTRFSRIGPIETRPSINQNKIRLD